MCLLDAIVIRNVIRIHSPRSSTENLRRWFNTRERKKQAIFQISKLMRLKKAIAAKQSETSKVTKTSIAYSFAPMTCYENQMLFVISTLHM